MSNAETTISRRALLTSVGLAISGTSGCLNLKKHFEVRAEGSDESSVFASVEMAGGLRPKMRVTLVEDAVGQVTELKVRADGGKNSHMKNNVELSPGQKSADMEMWFGQGEWVKNHLSAHDGSGEKLDEIVVSIQQTSWIGGNL